MSGLPFHALPWPPQLLVQLGRERESTSRYNQLEADFETWCQSVQAFINPGAVAVGTW